MKTLTRQVGQVHLKPSCTGPIRAAVSFSVGRTQVRSDPSRSSSMVLICFYTSEDFMVITESWTVLSLVHIKLDVFQIHLKRKCIEMRAKCVFFSSKF